MRTESLSPVGAAMARIRAEYARTRRRVADRAPAWARRSAHRTVVAVSAAGAIAVIALVYLVGVAEGLPAGAAFVLAGEPFSQDDLIRARRALQASGVHYRIDGQNRVEVAAERLTEANNALVKLNIGPRPLNEREKGAREASPFESLWARERREEQARFDQLAEILRRLDPETIAGATVEIHHPKGRPGQRPAPSATAFVYLETLDDREVNPYIQQSIIGMVASFAPEVKPEAVSLWDRRGRKYAAANDPAMSVAVRDRARAWELRREIQEKLDWIKGVQVSVNLVPAAPAAPPAPMPESAIALPLPPLPPAMPAEDYRPVPPTVGVNQPLNLEPEPDVGETPTEPPPVAQVAPPIAVTAKDEAPQAPAPAKVQVWVKVPSSYYLRASQSRQPSQDELLLLVRRTEDLARTAVEHVVPAAERGEVRVNTIPDELPAPSPPLPASTDVGRPLAWWVPAAAGAGASAAFVLLASRLYGARPALRSATRSHRGRFKIDEPADQPAGPGPSERARELIRANPEAAASVLLRWTGQGGPTA